MCLFPVTPAIPVVSVTVSTVLRAVVDLLRRARVAARQTHDRRLRFDDDVGRRFISAVTGRRRRTTVRRWRRTRRTVRRVTRAGRRRTVHRVTVAGWTRRAIRRVSRAGWRRRRRW